MPEDERAAYEDLAMKSQNARKAAITADSVHAQANVADTMGGSPHAAGLEIVPAADPGSLAIVPYGSIRPFFSLAADFHVTGCTDLCPAEVNP